VLSVVIRLTPLQGRDGPDGVKGTREWRIKWGGYFGGVCRAHPCVYPYEDQGNDNAPVMPRGIVPTGARQAAAHGAPGVQNSPQQVWDGVQTL
jgi:hypothetical protein